MSALRLDGVFLKDIWRIESGLRAHGAADIPQRIGEILDAQGVLTERPMIEREVSGEQRELIIGQDSLIDVALYRYDLADDEVAVLDLRICGFVDLWISGFSEAAGNRI